MPILPTEPRRRATLIAAAVAVVCAGAVAFVALGPLSATPTPAPTLSVAASPTPSATPTPTATPSTSPADAVDAPVSTTVAAVRGDSVPVSATAGGASGQTLSNPQQSGAPLVFRVVDRQDGWVRVQLPQRPNGSLGWVPAGAVTLSEDPYAIVVTRSENTLDLYKAGKVVNSYPVATGTGGTPTPTGRFALTELLAPTNAGYGPYAYGTTAFSDVLNSFGGGPGQIGLHGTDDTSSIGTAASHGCVRMHNADITALAELLPLGTPIQVR
ncbi:L,D-transpeptidase [Curtobacterium flaccumfaciens]|uniref:L,D-transpeptidase n=1 Tax=Curtobacterium flaccumfaciens TaxID=2035 RepID=UPI0025498B37|nr:L,D-transpeptidase [Curtobacterium flaccumfaciens]